MICEEVIIVKAYSPWDAIDAEYRKNNPHPITARGVDCYVSPYGIAAYLPNYPRGTTISIPGYRDGKPTLVDDTGGKIRQAKGKLIEVRFPASKEAAEWGMQTLKVKIFIPDKENK
jgi:3D (Asp-Asp-Asp) domain-containing protein